MYFIFLPLPLLLLPIPHMVDAKETKERLFRLPRFSEASNENKAPTDTSNTKSNTKPTSPRQKKKDPPPIINKLRKLTPIFTRCFANPNTSPRNRNVVDIDTDSDDERIADLVNRALADQADCSLNIINGRGPSRVERIWHEGLPSFDFANKPTVVADSDLD